MSGPEQSAADRPHRPLRANSDFLRLRSLYAVRPRLRDLPAMDDVDPSAFDVGIDSSSGSNDSNWR